MRYKSQLSGKLKVFIEWQLEHYHENKRELESYKNDMIPSPVPKYTDEPHCSGGENRPTENLALKMAMNTYLLQLEICVHAIERVVNRLDEKDLKIVEMVYWKGQYTPEGAGLIVGYSRSAVYARLNAILTEIGRELGYIQI